VTRVLLTGASGFIGANLVRRLQRDGHEIHAILRDDHDPWRLADVRAAVQVHAVDLRAAAGVAKVVREVTPEWVFHLAAYGAYPEQRDARRIVETDLIATIDLADACLAARVPAFVHAGSSSEYGLKDHAPAENERVDPNSVYAVAKSGATQYLRAAGVSNGLRYVTLRLYSAYGPYEEPTRLIPRLTLRGIAGGYPAFAAPATARDFVYVDDVVEAFLAAAARGEPGGIYNIGSGRQTTIRDAAEVARRVCNIATEPAWGSYAARSWDTAVWVADPGLAREKLGWSARTTFEDGFRQTVEWFRSTPAIREFYEARWAAAQ